ncbi:MAG: aminotransferase class V-fold PLP-dependent enzyme [Phycisphaerales bacterium]
MSTASTSRATAPSVRPSGHVQTKPAPAPTPAAPVEVPAPEPAPAYGPTAMHPIPFWPVEPGLTMLNHGSYGVTPRPVIEAQWAMRRRMESDPARFFIVELERLMDVTRRRLGEFMGVDPDWLAPAGNASIALATAIRNAGIRPGDDVLVTSHEYASGLNELKRMSGSEGFNVVKADIPFPIRTAQQAVDAVLGAVTPRTRVAIVSHITSATALVLPIERIARELRARGVEVIADGAHTPGQIPLNLRDIPFSFYTASLHKWLGTPKGTGLMVVPPDRQGTYRPLWLSSRAENGRTDRRRFFCDFDYQGTGDFTGLLSVPAAIDAIGATRPGGWPEVMQANHDLVVRARRLVCEVLGLEPPAPDEMAGSMASIILPEPKRPQPKRLYEDALQDNLRDYHNIQVPVWRWGPRNLRVLRISAAPYNTMDDYRKLAEALNIELAREG